MTSEELQKLVVEANARYSALTPNQKMRHDYMQRRSFVRGSCPSSRDYAEWCAIVDKAMPDEKSLTDGQIAAILLKTS